MEPTKTETLNGGAEFVAELRNGSKVTVFIKQLPVRQMQAYLKAQENEAEMIDLACIVDGKPIKPNVVDNLTHDSSAALVTEIERINNDFFVQWGQRQRARASKLKATFAPENTSATS